MKILIKIIFFFILFIITSCGSDTTERNSNEAVATKQSTSAKACDIGKGYLSIIADSVPVEVQYIKMGSIYSESDVAMETSAIHIDWIGKDGKDYPLRFDIHYDRFKKGVIDFPTDSKKHIIQLAIPEKEMPYYAKSGTLTLDEFHYAKPRRNKNDDYAKGSYKGIFEEQVFHREKKTMEVELEFCIAGKVENFDE